jgi:heme A synthase
MEARGIERRLRISALLIVSGLFLGLVTLLWTHPLAFVAFAVFACPLVLIGVVLYLYSLVPRDTSK